jgi:hypothetical protein
VKTKVYISFDAANVPGEAATILTATACGPDVAEVSVYTALGPREVSVRLDLDQDDERISKVLALLEHYGVEVDTSTYTEYSDEDRQNARLLSMTLDSYHAVFAGPKCGTEYDLTNACPHCETGAKQTSLLYMAHDDMKIIRKDRAVRTIYYDILVDADLRKMLVNAGTTGISFGDVRARHENGSWSMVARDQILIEHTMPPMRGDLTAEDEQSLCKVCRRGGRMSIPRKPYREEDLVGIQDFNVAWEWFGEFRTADHRFGAHRSKPRVLVTPKVMNIFREAGVKSVDWWPVAIAE